MVLRVAVYPRDGHPHPEEKPGHRPFEQLSGTAQVLVEVSVHHAWIHGIGCHWEALGSELLLQVVGEQDKCQLALRISGMGTVAGPETEIRQR